MNMSRNFGGWCMIIAIVGFIIAWKGLNSKNQTDINIGRVALIIAIICGALAASVFD